MGKIYRLSLQELRGIIEEACKTVLANLQEYYANSRGNLVQIMAQMLGPICSHWCLIYYAEVYGVGREYLNHWRDEIGSFMTRINQTALKCGSDSKMRIKAANQAWEKAINGAKSVSFMTGLRRKMQSEDMVDKAKMDDAIQCLLSSKSTIITLMAMTSMKEINAYIQQNTQFGHGSEISR